MPVGIYIHIPFCRRKCPYCDFYSLTFSDRKADEYCEALMRNMKAYSGKFSADTLYFGGGTPILMGERLAKVLDCAKNAFGLENGEISFEANPCECDYELLARLREGGFNRISIGLQSADDNELAALGRAHSAEQGAMAVKNAAKAGFEDISVDIMLGIPYQTRDSLAKSLKAVMALSITHVSAYMLKIETETPFGKNPPTIPDEDLTVELYLDTVKQLGEAGFEQYEISNFSKKGYECKHNLKYWRCEEYLGIGASAHSFLDGKRFATKRDIEGFIGENIQSTYITDDNAGDFDERAMLALRLREGIELGICPKNFVDRANPIVAGGLARIENGRLSLTPNGMLISNEIIAKLLS